MRWKWEQSSWLLSFWDKCCQFLLWPQQGFQCHLFRYVQKSCITNCYMPSTCLISALSTNYHWLWCVMKAFAKCILLPFPVVSTGCNVEGSVRLVGGRNKREGVVEVCLQSSWGLIWSLVCRDHWDIKESQVVCRQLGYSVLGELHAVINSIFLQWLFS